MLFVSKKAVSEVVSYLLLTLVVALISFSAFLFAQNYLEQVQFEADRDVMENNLNQITLKYFDLAQVTGRGTSHSVSFSSGQLVFENNETYYTSMVTFEGNPYCLDLLCYEAAGTSERMISELPYGFIFNENVSLTPGSYTLYFESTENEEITIAIR